MFSRPQFPQRDAAAWRRSISISRSARTLVRIHLSLWFSCRYYPVCKIDRQPPPAHRHTSRIVSWSSGSSSFMALITSDPRLSTGPRMARMGSRSGGSGVLRLLVPPAPPGGLVRQRTTAHVDGRRAGRRWIRGADRVRARGRACPRRPVPPLLRGRPARPRVHGVALGPPTRRAGGRRSPAAGRCRSPRPDMAAGRSGCAGGSPSAPRRRAGTTWRRRPARRWRGRSARPARLARRPPGAATDIGLLGDAGM